MHHFSCNTASLRHSTSFRLFPYSVCGLTLTLYTQSSQALMKGDFDKRRRASFSLPPVSVERSALLTVLPTLRVNLSDALFWLSILRGHSPRLKALPCDEESREFEEKPLATIWQPTSFFLQSFPLSRAQSAPHRILFLVKDRKFGSLTCRPTVSQGSVFCSFCYTKWSL